jgi:hypothetical protein
MCWRSERYFGMVDAVPPSFVKAPATALVPLRCIPRTKTTSDMVFSFPGFKRPETPLAITSAYPPAS